MRASASLPLLIGLVTQLPATVALKNDFSAYPQGSQQCLSDSADQSKCSGNTGKEMNQCLCSNQGNFIYDTATCVSKNSPNDLSAVYDTMKNNCAGTGVTIAVSKEAFMSQANAATATTTGSPAPTKGPGSTDDDDSDGNGISKGGKIGLGVGIVFGAIALGLLGWFVWMYSQRRKRRRSQYPSNPSHPDVELYQNNNNDGSRNPTVGGSTLNGYPTSPAPEYAQHNGQFGFAELPPEQQQDKWKELPADQSQNHRNYYDNSPLKSAHSYKHLSGEPLLQNRSELGSDGARSPVPPVELPAEVVYHDTRSVGGARSPESGFRVGGR
ncbi:uncharacterized protein F4822DRAFT_423924 [Hypoxylon trugodes]|uniref:uncharacterized protein n=1 Tax=Hypoxylon trugodes TaxID=326681 RepID=UPI0021913A52|nr:uncharacterized protein F4822DRAFT_423924 [Hypoxylon trugodes]KAI1393455.1 hypothetical protein F4822DRAFT_423924 [Hypoxylon trugodes]